MFEAHHVTIAEGDRTRYPTLDAVQTGFEEGNPVLKATASESTTAKRPALQIRVDLPAHEAEMFNKKGKSLKLGIGRGMGIGTNIGIGKGIGMAIKYSGIGTGVLSNYYRY